MATTKRRRYIKVQQYVSGKLKDVEGSTCILDTTSFPNYVAGTTFHCKEGSYQPSKKMLVSEKSQNLMIAFQGYNGDQNATIRQCGKYYYPPSGGGEYLSTQVSYDLVQCSKLVANRYYSIYSYRKYQNDQYGGYIGIAAILPSSYSPTTQVYLYTHNSDYPPYIEDTLEDIKIESRNHYPTSFVDVAKKTEFGWQPMQVGSGLAEDNKWRDQKSAVIEWKEVGKEGVHTIQVNKEASTYVANASAMIEVPANTFPNNSSFQWRVKITSDDNVVGDFSDWITVSTTDVAGTVRALSPDNAIIDIDVDNRFSWVYNNPYGTEPTGYEIEISSNGGVSWQQIKKATTSDCFADIPAGTLSAGNIQYRIRAFSQSGIASEWAVANITVRARPQIPSIYRVDTSADRPTVWWESVDQEAYELKILDSSGSVIYTHYAALPDRSHRITKRLDNAQYTAALTIWNGFGLDSPTAQRQFTLAAIKPGKPTASGTAFSTHNSLMFVHTTSKSILLRGGVAIADVSGLGTYDDYTAPASCEYRLRALSDTAFCDSDPLALTYPGSGRAAAMSLASDHNVRVSLIYKEGSPPERSSVLNAEYALMQFAGRKLPVAEYGDQLTRTKSLSYSLRNTDDLRVLRSMVGQTVVWNDRQDHMVACLSNLSWSERRGFVDVSFTITEIDSNEGIDYE